MKNPEAQRLTQAVEDFSFIDWDNKDAIIHEYRDIFTDPSKQTEDGRVPEKIMILTESELAQVLPGIELSDEASGKMKDTLKALFCIDEVPGSASSSGESKYEVRVAKLLTSIAILSPNAENVNEEEKAQLMFNMIDVNNTGYIVRAELCKTIQNSALDNALQLSDAELEAVADALIQDMDRQETGRITFEDFKDSVNTKDATLNPLRAQKKAEDFILRSKSMLFSTSDLSPLKKSPFHRVRVFCSIHPQEVIFMTLYLFLNCGLFFAYFGYVYADAAKRLALGLGAPLAKGCAGILYLNIPLSFLTMSRTFMTWARTSKLKYLIPFDHATLFHQIVGGVIVLASTGHISGHLISTFRNAAKVDDLVALNSVVENFTFKSLPTYTWLIFQSGPGMSGVIITLALILLTVTALPSVRKRHFNLFWYTHHLFVVFTGALFAHGTWQYVQFPHMVFYLGIPFLWYVWERVLRWYRAVFVLYEVSLITIQPERTIRIQLTPKNKTCNYRPGQYVYVNFPNIARFEWHPYTLTSSPLEQNLVIYIRANGNWSNEVVRLAKNDPEALSSVRIDGPFGAPAEHFGDFKNIMLIGTGIGVTPFAGILRDMQIKVLERNETMSKLQRVDLYWVNRSRGAFTWFVQLLRDLEQPKTQSMIRVHTFITSANSSRDIRSVLLWKGLSLLRNESNSSVLTGLAREAYWGRPDWELIFEQTAAKFSGGTVGVFFCGPEVLAEELWQLARKKSASTRCRFVFRMENF